MSAKSPQTLCHEPTVPIGRRVRSRKALTLLSGAHDPLRRGSFQPLCRLSSRDVQPMVIRILERPTVRVESALEVLVVPLLLVGDELQS